MTTGRSMVTSIETAVFLRPMLSLTGVGKRVERLVAAALGQVRRARHAYQLAYARNMDPSFSPDGKKLVYISVISGREQLFIMNADGFSSVQLTHDDADHEDPAWSPRGDKIAFCRVDGAAEVIYVMNVDGSHAEAVSPKEVQAIHPAWGADGAQLA
jgi:TolB protein